MADGNPVPLLDRDSLSAQYRYRYRLWQIFVELTETVCWCHPWGPPRERHRLPSAECRSQPVRVDIQAKLGTPNIPSHPPGQLKAMEAPRCYCLHVVNQSPTDPSRLCRLDQVGAPAPWVGTQRGLWEGFPRDRHVSLPFARAQIGQFFAQESS